MNRVLKSLIAGALVLPAMGYAEGLSYSYVEGSFINQDIDDLDVDGDGFGLRGSLAIAPSWHLFADLSKIDYDFDIDGTNYAVGVGYNHSISQAADFIGRLAWVKAELDTPIGDADEDGFGLAALVRGKPMTALELEGGVEYVDFGGNEGDDTALIAAGRYFFTNAFSAGLGLSVSDDVTQWGANFRLNFK